MVDLARSIGANVITALVLAVSIGTSHAPLVISTSTTAAERLTPRVERVKLALDECTAVVEHMAIDLAEVERAQIDLERRVGDLARRPTPVNEIAPRLAPELPSWMWPVIFGAAVVGTILGAVGAIAVVDAVQP